MPRRFGCRAGRSLSGAAPMMPLDVDRRT
jgi:hypothetical protein